MYYYAPQQIAVMIVTVIPVGHKPLRYTWKGDTVAAIHKRAHQQYGKQFPGCNIVFGSGYYVKKLPSHHSID